MPKISLKVHFPDEGHYKVLPFDDNTKVAKAIEEIYNKQNVRKANVGAAAGKCC